MSSPQTFIFWDQHFPRQFFVTNQNTSLLLVIAPNRAAVLFFDSSATRQAPAIGQRESCRSCSRKRLRETEIWLRKQGADEGASLVTGTLHQPREKLK